MLMGYVESNEPDIFSDYETATISIICPDPNIYSAGDDRLLRVVFSGVEAKFEFPFENNSLTEKLLEMGSIQSKKEQNVYYEGDSDIGILIIIHAIGTVEKLTIYNSESRGTIYIDTDKLTEMTGNPIIYGDIITINTRKGEKGATLLREGITYNILNCIARNATWFTLSKGNNIFAYTAEEGAEMTEFTIEAQLVYEGV
jgi:hypothetical protein